jgi:hypothetical protein
MVQHRFLHRILEERADQRSKIIVARSAEFTSFIIFTDTIEFALTEHISFRWCNIDNIRELDWAEADKDILKHLERYLER